MEVVDSAIPNLEKVAPSITKYTAIGMILGAFFTIVVLTISALLDDTVRDEEYVLKAYDYPILGKVPDLLDNGNRSYAYYSQRRTTKKTQGKEG